MKIGGGGFFLCMLCIYRYGCVHSVICLEYREPVVGGHWLADGLVCLLLTLILIASSLCFLVCGSFAKKGVLPLCHGGGRAALL